MRVFEVHALPGAAQFDLFVSVDQLERNFAAAVADGVIDFAKSPATGAALDGITIERAVAVLVVIAAKAIGAVHRRSLIFLNGCFGSHAPTPPSRSPVRSELT